MHAALSSHEYYSLLRFISGEDLSDDEEDDLDVVARKLEILEEEAAGVEWDAVEIRLREPAEPTAAKKKKRKK